MKFDYEILKIAEKKKKKKKIRNFEIPGIVKEIVSFVVSYFSKHLVLSFL